MRSMVGVVREVRPEVVFVQSPHAFGTGEGDVRAVVGAARGAAVVYWEGDAWGGLKRFTAAGRAWLGAADRVFSIAMGPQARLLRSFTRAPIGYVPHVLPYEVRPAAGDRVPDIGAATVDVTVVGSRQVRLGVVGCLPGAKDRQRLVRALQRLDCRLA
ncbi:hypothetical protein, partial [Kitasatospora arboriphila]|uniref:hypothetical protein n=1 Tax=Kitasatospora arboriphila TaxID=258052 RepID=UPI0031DFCDC3